MTATHTRSSVLLIACFMVMALALPQFRDLLEGQLATHVLVQMPLLVFAGWHCGQVYSRSLERPMQYWNAGGVPGLLLVMFVLLFWMLPRSVDGAAAQVGFEIGKFISLPLAGGVLALSFPRAPILIRGAIKANVVSMCVVLAWLYSVAPIRLCTSYLASEQLQLGRAFALCAAMLSIVWGASLLFELGVRGRLLVPPRTANAIWCGLRRRQSPYSSSPQKPC